MYLLKFVFTFSLIVWLLAENNQHSSASFCHLLSFIRMCVNTLDTSSYTYRHGLKDNEMTEFSQKKIANNYLWVPTGSVGEISWVENKR